MLVELRLSEGSCLVGGSCLVVGGSFPVLGNNQPVARDNRRVARDVLPAVDSKEGAQARVPYLFSQRPFCLYG